MKKILLPACMLFNFAIHAQYATDNVKYTTVFPQDLCKTLQAHPGYILLDVRSQGEFDDSLSNSPSLNIGHISIAQHIDVRQLPTRWRELLAYKDKPVFIYCSHSQRSRRASRLLSDSGFVNIFNINEGLTGFYIDNLQNNACPLYSIETHLPYKILSPQDVEKGLPGFTVIDLRDDSTFRGISSKDGANTHGHFEKAIHIPFDQLISSLASIPKNKSLLLVDSYGDISAKAAMLLHVKGYDNLSILFNGMDEWLDYSVYNEKNKIKGWVPGISYSIISPDQYIKFAGLEARMSLIDIRTKEEFTNQAKNSWQSIGQVKNAVNIPSGDILNHTANNLPVSKDSPLVIYGFNNNDYIYATAKSLQQSGYKNVMVLRGGVWGLRWWANNKPGKAAWADLVINVPAENQ
jgi:rhodanese-related sulfurtransferase